MQLCEAVGQLNADGHSHARVQRRASERRRQTLSLNMLVRERQSTILVDDLEQSGDGGVRNRRCLLGFGEKGRALDPITGDVRMYEPHKCRTAASRVARAVGLTQPILAGSLQ